MKVVMPFGGMSCICQSQGCGLRGSFGYFVSSFIPLASVGVFEDSFSLILTVLLAYLGHFTEFGVWGNDSKWPTTSILKCTMTPVVLDTVGI